MHPKWLRVLIPKPFFRRIEMLHVILPHRLGFIHDLLPSHLPREMIQRAGLEHRQIQHRGCRRVRVFLRVHWENLVFGSAPPGLGPPRGARRKGLFSWMHHRPHLIFAYTAANAAMSSGNEAVSAYSCAFRIMAASHSVAVWPPGGGSDAASASFPSRSPAGL